MTNVSERDAAIQEGPSTMSAIMTAAMAVTAGQARHVVCYRTAIYRDPMTMDDYLSTRIISDPLCMFDCDAPIDGSVAFIVSSLDAAKDLKNSPLRVEAMSGAMCGKDSWDQFEDITSMPALDVGAHLWDRIDLKPADMDVANIYDGFSIQPVIWQGP
jgi:acetyl-CoA acetyltransferase